MYKEGNEGDSSAFKPYSKLNKSIPYDAKEPQKQLKTSQTQPFDYTVDNLLNKSSKVSTQSHLVNSTTSEQSKQSVLPFDLITHHLLWQTHQQLSQDKLHASFHQDGNFDIKLRKYL